MDTGLKAPILVGPVIQLELRSTESQTDVEGRYIQKTLMAIKDLFSNLRRICRVEEFIVLAVGR